MTDLLAVIERFAVSLLSRLAKARWVPPAGCLLASVVLAPAAALPLLTNVAQEYEKLVDARVRVAGVCGAQGDPTRAMSATARLYVNHYSDLIIERKSLGNAFQLPVDTVAAVSQRGTNNWVHQVHLQGRVEGTGERLRLHDETGSVWVQAPAAESWQTNRWAEVIGFPALTPEGLVLEDAQLRYLAPQLKVGLAARTNRNIIITRSVLLPELTGVQDIRKLSPEEAERGYPVRVEAVVTYHDRDWSIIFVQDETAGIYVDTHGHRFDVAEGTRVALEGFTGPGEFAPVIRYPQIRKLGAMPLPSAKPVTLDLLKTGKEDSQRVEIGGIVRTVHRETGHLFLEVATHGGNFRVQVPKVSRQAMPTNLVDARVIVRGVSSTIFNKNRQLLGVQVNLPALRDIEVIEPAPLDPFTMPVQSISSLMRFNTDAEVSRRVHVQGTVTFQQLGEFIFIQNRVAGLRVVTKDRTVLRPGDRVAVVGFPAVGSLTPMLQDATVRKVGSEAPPQPVRVPAARASSRDYRQELLEGRLVEVEARLLDHYGNQAGQTFTLQSQDLIFHARLPEPWKAGEVEWVRGSLLRLTGVYALSASQPGAGQGFELFLRSRQDLTVLDREPWWTARWAVSTLAALGLCTILGIAWVLALRRRVRRQTEHLRQQYVRETAFSNLGLRLSGTTSPGEAARVILDIADQLLGWDASYLHLFSPTGQKMARVLSFDLIEGQRISLPCIYEDLEPSPMDLAIREGQARLILREPNDDPGSLIPFGDTARPSASLLFVPIRHGTAVIGALSIQSYRAKAYDERDLGTLQALADHCGGALERLRAERELRAAHQELERLVRERTAELSEANASLKQEMAERQRTSVALLHEEFMLRTFLENVPDSIYFKDREGRFVRVNRAFAERMGLTDSAVIIGKTDFDFFDKEVAQLWFDDEQKVIQTGEPMVGIEEKEVLLDGRELWVSTTKMPWRDRHGTIVGTFGLSRDITSRKAAEMVLAKQQHELQVILDSVPAFVIFKDAKNSVLWINRYAAQLYGQPADCVRGKSSYELHPAQAEKFYEDDLEVMTTGRPKLGIEEPFTTGAGETRWLLTDKIPYRNNTGEMVGVIVFAVDITERKQAAAALQEARLELEHRVTERTAELWQANALLKQEIDERARMEETLRQSEERFSKAFRASPVSIGITTLTEGRFVDVNDGFQRLLGHTREEVIGRTVQELGIWVDLAERDRIVRLVRAGQPVRNLECKFRSKTGEQRHTLVSAEQIELATGPCLLFLTHDITERVNLEAQLRHSQKLDAVGQLAAGVAHDFNNLLTVIQGHSGLMQANDKISGELADSLREITGAADRAANLTRQLLTFSRKQPMQPRALDLNEVVGNLSKMLRRLLGEPIAMQFNFAPHLPAIFADSGMVEQIVVNIAVNARDAMPNGGHLIISTSIAKIDAAYCQAHSDARPGKFACLSIADTGCGIDPESLHRIFEPFFTTKEVGKGSGLGLATVYGIVRQHEGWIEVTSELNQGTTFHVFLPIREDLRIRNGYHSPTPKIRGGNETILVVEDESAVRDLVSGVLQRYGYRVLLAESGLAALKVWDQVAQNIRLLLTDMVMPEGLSGRELALRLQEQQPELKVIYTSGYSLELAEPFTRSEPAPRLLPKPYAVRQLAQVVREYLDE